MDKPTVFLSHIGEEKELASIFKTHIEKSFIGMVDIFMSSDAQSIPLGQNWLDRVTQGLRTCKAMLLLCSPSSIKRPWINFEAGAGWARNIEVAPICHSGLRPVDLPLPMSLLQGLEANDPNRVNQVFQLIAKQLGSAEPDVDVDAVVASVKAFETSYVVRLAYETDAAAFNRQAPHIVAAILAAAPDMTLTLNGIPERDFIMLRPSLDNLQSAGGLQHSFGVTSMTIGGSAGGAFGSLGLKVSGGLYNLLKQMRS